MTNTAVIKQEIADVYSVMPEILYFGFGGAFVVAWSFVLRARLGGGFHTQCDERAQPLSQAIWFHGPETKKWPCKIHMGKSVEF